MTILFISPDANRWQTFADALGSRMGATIDIVTEGARAIERIRTTKPLAVVISEQLDDRSGLDLVREIMAVDAMIHVALVSTRSKTQFHEMTEGLGIVMQLPARPDLNEAHALATRLVQIAGIA